MRKQGLRNGADWRLPSIRELTTDAFETPDLAKVGSAEEGLLGQLGLAHLILPIHDLGFNPTGPYWQKVVHHNHFGVSTLFLAKPF